MAMSKQIYIDHKQQILTENAELQELKAKVSQMQYTGGSADDKEFLKFTACSLMSKYPDFRRAILKSSKKADLPTSITNVIDRTLSHNNAVILTIEEKIKEILDRELACSISAARQELIDRVWSQKKQFIQTVSNVEEWECLIECIRSGDITESQLPSYGINLE